MSLNRRRFLAAVGTSATTGLAGCFGDDADWPTFGHDGHNTNYNPAGSAPTDSPTERWRVESYSTSAQPVVADGTVYAPVGADVLAIDAASGEVKWSADPENRGAIYWAPPTVRDGVAYLGDGDERLRAFDAESGEVLWERTFGDETFEAVYGAPTFGHNTDQLYVGTSGGYVYELDPETGETVWRRSVFGSIETTLAVHQTQLFAATTGGDVYALGTSGGGHWQTPLPDLSRSAPAVADGRLYVGCFDGKVYAIDVGRGTVEWSTGVGGFAKGGIAVADGRVFVDGGREVKVLDAESGQRLWSVGVGSSGDHTPIVVGDTLYTGGDTLYAFDVSGGVGIGDLRVGATRFAKRFQRGVSQVAAGDGLLVAGVGESEDDHYVVAFE
ncbi:Outer membrane protein assembly factor BamB, contains PQQ-like beta-propeller repeat [Halogranum amylolyticum]|uniref:Outer membrane protein assembly factor BamB, contains PQQ-like beta-propeller repeat n=1 Tax=Halogranum amylolyticum TaxID=660520 RepID=A0A1H8N9I2_9EURY|nr:PQQ-binding-like beta-propeller repeat protein [Halogranum amylolyticum]SEO26351.1 Outer membrane protein assembly factor BamB, contains PQQ-like beta-propeller repeat [Halogranum amylolyticum]